MKKTLAICSLLLFSTTSVNAQEPQLDSRLKCLLSDNLEIIQTKAEFGSQLNLENMAEKDGRYNKTDVDDGEYPFRQFIVGGACKNSLFVAFNYGGRASGQELDFYQTKNSQRIASRYWLCEKIRDFDSLKDAIKSGKAQFIEDRIEH